MDVKTEATGIEKPDMDAPDGCYPGKKSVDQNIQRKYSKGNIIKDSSLRKSFKRHKILKKDAKLKRAEEIAARAEIILPESSSYIETESYETSELTQRDIRGAVDITAATKSFDLHLKEFGPYKFRYLKNGRHLILAGRKGHLASFDWVTKKLHCEINLMESIHDVCYLHNETMIAAAQKKWTYIYDNNGVELHCLKRMDNILKLEFLPYHFLLCSGSESGFLSWMDVTTGQEAIQFPTHKGRLNILTQNPWNAVLCCGHSNGTVTMWTPNSKDYVASMLCHGQPLTDIAVDPTGTYLATAAVDRVVKIWDSRKLGQVFSAYKFYSVPHQITFSQRGLLALSLGNSVEVYKDVRRQKACEVYLKHETNSPISRLQFCPYEDVLGVSTQKGFSSLIIPGSGEPNFDALEANPYRGVSARKESDVKAVLGKIPSDFITLDPQTAVQVDVNGLQESLDAKKKLAWVKVPKYDIVPKYRMKGKSGSAQKFRRKKLMHQQKIREQKAALREKEMNMQKDKDVNREEDKEDVKSVLDRFKSKR